MELTKNKWNKKDIKEFQEYLKSFENIEKKEWSTNLLRTKLPVLCISTPTMKEIIDKIYKGNYIEFLDLMIWEYYENTAINGFLISKIEDFEIMKKYLDIYSNKADNWATCDLLTFDIKDCDEKYFKLSEEYVKSSKPFVRRIGLYILFKFVEKEEYIDKIFETLNLFTKEEEYYVNMMCGWLLSECYIKNKNRTIKYFEKNNLNIVAINKAIQKCRESRRVSKEEKEELLKYKKKKNVI